MMRRLARRGNPWARQVEVIRRRIVCTVSIQRRRDRSAAADAEDFVSLAIHCAGGGAGPPCRLTVLFSFRNPAFHPGIPTRGVVFIDDLLVFRVRIVLFL